MNITASSPFIKVYMNITASSPLIKEHEQELQRTSAY